MENNDKPRFNTWAWNRKHWKRIAFISIIISFGIAVNSEEKPQSFFKSNKIELSTLEEQVLLSLLTDDAEITLRRDQAVFNLSYFGIDKKLKASELADAYDKNEVAADEQYKGKNLLITGAINSIDKDFTDTPVVSLRGRNIFMDVRAYMNDQELNSLGKLKKGQSIDIVCEGEGMVIGSPILRNCLFAETAFHIAAKELIDKYFSGQLKQDKDIALVMSFGLALATVLPENTNCNISYKDPGCKKEIKSFVEEKTEIWGKSIPDTLKKLVKMDLTSQTIFKNQKLFMDDSSNNLTPQN